jgi:hypothetical protein
VLHDDQEVHVAVEVEIADDQRADHVEPTRLSLSSVLISLTKRASTSRSSG